MTEIPPPRYRVIERDRRLEVVDTQATRRAKRPSRGSMAAGRLPPRMSLPRNGEPVTKLVLAWTALVLAAIIGVAAFATMGLGAVIALALLVVGLYQKHKRAIDRWIAALG